MAARVASRLRKTLA